MNELKNKIKSVMIGHAIGDALGVPVEFFDREELVRKPITDMVGYGTYNMPAGTWSDDTSMSLGTLDALCRKDWEWDHVMKSFVDWLVQGLYTPAGESFDVGHTCLEAIIGYCRREADALSCGRKGEYSNGNGSLMRIHPFMLYAYAKQIPYKKWMELVEHGSQITHAHERSKLACLIYAFVLDHLLREQSKGAFELGLRRAECHLRDYGEMSCYKRLFSRDFSSLSCDEIKSSGYVVDTLEAAFWCVLTTESYKDCVLKAVNLGGDTDTIAAIAGGLAGALYGYDNIPEEWKSRLVKKEYIEEMCERAAVSWTDF